MITDADADRVGSDVPSHQARRLQLLSAAPAATGPYRGWLHRRSRAQAWSKRLVNGLTRRRFLRLVAATGVPTFVRIARAELYPTRPVRIIVGFAAGGPTDLVARVIGQWLSERLSQQFVVENRIGARPPTSRLRRSFLRPQTATRFS
jgi:hypothetical protein